MSVAFDTDWPADSVEFCPSSHRNLIACGTYKLDEISEPPPDTPQKQHRQGQCILFEILSEGEHTLQVTVLSYLPIGAYHPPRQMLQRISLPAVLDMKWRVALQCSNYLLTYI